MFANLCPKATDAAAVQAQNAVGEYSENPQQQQHSLPIWALLAHAGAAAAAAASLKF